MKHNGGAPCKTMQNPMHLLERIATIIASLKMTEVELFYTSQSQMLNSATYSHVLQKFAGWNVID